MDIIMDTNRIDYRIDHRIDYRIDHGIIQVLHYPF